MELPTLEGMPWRWIPAGLAIAVTVLSVNFAGDGIRDALDPRTVLD
jgi:peptide/nickel transport system permease protein